MINIANSVGYSGEVQAKLTRDDKVVKFKNAGTPTLWNAIAAAMVGNNIVKSIPKYFNVAYEAGNIRTSCLIKHLPFTGKVTFSDDTCAKAKFTCLVKKSDVATAILSGTAYLEMYNHEGELLAEIQDDADKNIVNIHNSITDGVNAVYEWTMIFSNTSSITLVDNNQSTDLSKEEMD